jgi:UDP-N-acetylglucosamine--N-acetylmuramyl-(pentapeptide) pyrophosphoryl-undecaprenol N-acetylglucosamine transferase
VAKTIEKRIFLTGGGTAGHVVPNLALLEDLRADDYELHYLGDLNGIEVELATAAHLPFHGIKTGKLRRYFSWQNFIDPFKVILGTLKSFWLCLTYRPVVVISKGGFVSLPVVLGAWLARTPVILHESDYTPGLANKLSFPFAKKICVSFEDTKKFIKQKKKVVVTGSPVRPELLQGNKQRGLEFVGIDENKPVLLIICGSLGSEKINKLIRDNLWTLLRRFSIVHICGKGKVDESLNDKAGYKQFEFVGRELPDLFACADFVISRAGSNTLFELIALAKPHLLIPLSKQASRGDQIVNAKYFKELGMSLVLDEDTLTDKEFLQELNVLQEQADQLCKQMKNFPQSDGKAKILELIAAL